MEITSIQYSERDHLGQTLWNLAPLKINKTNLIIGKNSAGKSRAVNCISKLVKIITSGRPAQSGEFFTFEVKFSDTERHRNYHYFFEFSGRTIIRETMSINEQCMLERNTNGHGKILAEKLNDYIEFQIPQHLLATVLKRDTIQHEFLEPLHNWAETVRHYHFGSSLGKDSVVIFREGDSVFDAAANDKDENFVVGVFKEGSTLFGTDFLDEIIKDMKFIGYDIDSILIGKPSSITSNHPVSCIVVNEHGLTKHIDQMSMSQGMFRALSILIHINFACFAKKSICLIIDDIGEGLDFSRSTLLIQKLREKASSSNMQLIMTSNDKFIINACSLHDISILKRTGNSVNVINSENSPDAFDDFKFMGLNNFSIIELDVI